MTTDQVQIVTPGYLSVTGSAVTGNGTSGNQFRGVLSGGAYSDVAPTSATGNATLTWPPTTALSSVNLIFSQNTLSVPAPYIGISDVTFSNCV